MTNARGVAVTGVGAMTPVGGTVTQTWDSLIAGRSGIRGLDEPWAQDLPVRIAGLVSTDPAASLSTREYRRMDRCGHLALIASREAWAQAGMPAVEPDRLGVVIGSGYGGLGTVLSQVRVLDGMGPRRVSPHTLTQIMVNGPSAWVSMDIGAQGGARTPVSACASGAEAIAQGVEMIAAGVVDVVVAGGVDACVNDLAISGFAQLRALSTSQGDPAAASRPFDRDRNGFVMGEGAGIIVLEREEFARARGADILGRVAGTAVTSDARDIVAADQAIQQRVMQKALAAAGLAGSDIDFVHAHATSTPVGDLLEAGAISAVVGNDVSVTSTKSMTGHLLGGAGALGAIVALQALRTGLLPGTLNHENPDPEIHLNIIGTTTACAGSKAAITNAFGFGGHSTALVITAA
ncbi:beta-ketoacyl-[acyl-carrier-protein] synthase family protein [Arthrobacter agilis]|uniref:beta-ketoacyl-[acyl-carrier-protein] synthase family protein n=1 Tax=Arthrobacter agilis TaxID=37921 RepID=UPI002365D11A|nr:beta-ketoacyl-[acyl-carrier-protein] synthase family protein [Arthrobacter agilis]WDF32511.1 beta-ketoacyl-[acyl-carrier-protein] synthase family protein [Arthrobacter agilis]